MGSQATYGSPVYLEMQVQIGLWLWTVHSVFLPQDPMQGSTHNLLRQALSDGQLEFVVH